MTNAQSAATAAMNCKCLGMKTSLLIYESRLDKLFRSQRFYGKRMDRVRQQIADSGQHRLMPLETGNPRERLRHDKQRKVPRSVRCARMSSVLVTIVVDFQRYRSQVFEALPQHAFQVHHDRSGR